MITIITPEQIEDAAKESGRSMKDVCSRAGVARSTFTRWKARKHSPRLDVVERLAAQASKREGAA